MATIHSLKMWAAMFFKKVKGAREIVLLVPHDKIERAQKKNIVRR